MAEAAGGAAPWRAEDAWEGVWDGGRSGNPEGAPGVVLRLLGHVGIATIIARPGLREELGNIAEAQWGFALPAAGRTRGGGLGELVATAPDQWLAVGGPADDPAALAAALAGVAAVSAQGDGRALVEVDGPCARQALAKLISIDLHPQVFTPGCAAATAFAHLAVHLWQREGSSALTLCVPRTVAGSVWRTLLAAAAAFGCEAVAPDQRYFS